VNGRFTMQYQVLGRDGVFLKNARRVLSFYLAVFMLMAPLTANAAPDQGVGTVTGLPLPRYVSLKSDRVNLREGPSKENQTTWVFQRAGLPVEIVAEFETWRRIRDAEGAEGWVLHSLLSGRRTALVTPWVKGDAKGEGAAVNLYERADERAEVIAKLQPSVLTSVRLCTGSWCRIVVQSGQSGRALDGFIKQDRLWGVYPNERTE
jgi:SH3-like domain-containing protein